MAAPLSTKADTHHPTDGQSSDPNEEVRIGRGKACASAWVGGCQQITADGLTEGLAGWLMLGGGGAGTARRKVRNRARPEMAIYQTRTSFEGVNPIFPFFKSLKI